jgi:hypothetical protein
MPSVLFVNDNWGYGSTTTAIAIADQIVGVAERRFAGTGAALGLARRANFDGASKLDTMARAPAAKLKQMMQGSNVVVSIMNPRAARLAAEVGVECVYVDSLLWMWPTPPDVRCAAKYFAEWFPGLEARVTAWQDRLPRVDIVGPVISDLSSQSPTHRTDLLVNFGGMARCLVPQPALITYAAVLTQCIAEAAVDFPGSITVAIGSHLLERVETAAAPLSRTDITFADLSHNEYLQHLDRSSVLISSAGLHAAHEAFVRDVPCLFLPSQNLSQALTLPSFRASGLACLPDWDRIYGLEGLAPAEEPKACREIGDCIQRFRNDEDARGRLVGNLREWLSSSQLGSLTAAQRVFIGQAGGMGAERIGRHLIELLSPVTVDIVSG